MVTQGNFLSAKMFFDSFMDIRPAFHRCIIGNDHAQFAMDFSDAGDDAGRRKLVVVLSPGGHDREFKEGRFFVNE